MPHKFLLFLAFFYSPLTLAKYQVCSITINSSDEINTFKEFLSPNDFDFVELLPSQINEKQDHSSHWFNNACEKNYRCDILVISGHFGGIFFGETGYSLPTELLEEKACQNKCPGILSNVKEIFLFGCNTLADKKKDSRTYKEYLQVLLDDGMARETAERVVAARYSPLGTPFYDRMNFIFSNSNTIYGFDQLSPLGKHIRRPLKKYFQSINQNFGSYVNYLNTGQYKRDHNSELFQHLPRSNFTLNQAHISLSNENSKKRKFFNDKCRLYDDTKNFTSRIQALKDIFESGQSGSAFFAIDYLLNRNNTEITEGQGRQVFRSIKDNKSLSREFTSYYDHLNFLPYIKLVYLNVLEKFQWIDPIDLHIFRKKDLLELIKKPDPEAYISLILLIKDNQIKPGQFYISKKDLPKNYIQNIWSLLIFEKLKAIAPEWQTDMTEMLKSCDNYNKQTPAICYQILNTLAHISPSLETAESAVKFLNHKDNVLIYYTIRMLGQSEITNYYVHKDMSSFLTHEDIELRKEALEALGFLRSPYTDIQEDIIQLLPHAGPQMAEEIFWSLGQMDLKSDSVQKTIIQYAIQNITNKKLLKLAFSALQNTSEFSDFTLSFFYDHLESRDNLELLLFIIETLSHNSQLRDLGIHYRFLKFQEEESIQLKQKALKKMASITWLHPEVQISFLDYIRDENSDVRILAINILRNINNFQEKTFNQIKILYEEEKIKELKVFF